MANKDSERFVRNLRASIGKWKMPDDTFALYCDRLASWTLNPEVWSRAISRIISENTTGDLPTLPAIYTQLRLAQQAESDTAGNGGWMTFLTNGKSHAMRIRSVEGKWVFAHMAVRSATGEIMELQPHPGQDARWPEQATELHVLPDNPDRHHYNRCSKQEAADGFRRGWVESGADLDTCPSPQIAASSELVQSF